MRNFTQSHKRNVLFLAAPLIIALALRLYVIFLYGPYYLSIHSDDMGYLRSAEWLLKYGTYSYYTHDAPTVHMLPGMTLILAAVIAVFGKETLGLYVGKIIFSFIGVAGILGAYKSFEYMWNRYVAFIVGIFLALYVPGIETDTLFLTETPFFAAFAWTIFFVLKLSDSHKLRHLISATVLFMVAVYFRPDLLLWVIPVLIYLVIKRYPIRLLIRHGCVAIGIVVVCLAPWWIRNAIVFHQFIPLTDDSGNPLLLGTFQGIHYPPPNNPTAVEQNILHAHPNLSPPDVHEVPWFKEQQNAAIHRMREWLSYLWIKPGQLWGKVWYPLNILHIKNTVLSVIQLCILWVSLIGHGVSLVFGHRKRKEVLFILLTLLYFTALFSFYFVYSRYNEPIMWLMFSGVPTGIWSLCYAFRSPDKGVLLSAHTSVSSGETEHYSA